MEAALQIDSAVPSLPARTAEDLAAVKTTQWALPGADGTRSEHPIVSLSGFLAACNLGEYEAELNSSELNLASLKDLADTDQARLEAALEEAGVVKPFHRKRIVRAAARLRWTPEFELGEVLGEGGFGSVHRGIFRGTAVAIKVVRPRRHGERLTGRDLVRLRREAKAAMLVQNQHVLRVLESVERYDQTEFCLVMQLVEGLDLDNYLESKRDRVLAEEEAVGLISQCLNGLHAIHYQGMVHRDIKPANIRLERKDDGALRPVILDFGLAKATFEGGAEDESAGKLSTLMFTTTDAVVGTPEYMSPEVWKGIEKDVDHRCDIFAMGVCLFQLLTGELPYPLARGEPRRNLIGKVLFSKQAMPCVCERARDGYPISKEVGIVVGMALKKSQGQRYQVSGASFSTYVQYGGVDANNLALWSAHLLRLHRSSKTSSTHLQLNAPGLVVVPLDAYRLV